MYHVSAQGTDEHMINNYIHVHYYYQKMLPISSFLVSFFVHFFFVVCVSNLNMYHVSAQGTDEHMINNYSHVRYYYVRYTCALLLSENVTYFFLSFLLFAFLFIAFLLCVYQILNICNRFNS